MSNSDEDLTADADKMNEDENNMKISTNEEKNTVEHQETFKIDVKILPKNK